MTEMTNLMVTLPGYRVNDKIYDGSRTLVYRGIRESDQQPIVLKQHKSEYPTFAELVQFRNQYIITKNLNLPGIISPISLENYRNGFALVMEDFGGISLKEYTNSRNLSLEEFFHIGIAIAETLEGLYLNRIIHKDIKPHNILINPETKQIKLIDFSISSLLPKENQEIQNPNVLEGTLTYMSPEQTGRMNRGIDYRTDFYSLGVTFYELLTNRLPFQSNDPMELVYCHIAKKPTPPIEVNPSIPQMVNDIILKLMAKTPEERYQTAFGLRYDLENCLRQWQTNGEIPSFTLGQRDISDRFFIPEKLYGRETEVFTLLAAFDRISQGTSEMMLVAGFSGIGKTAVVNEVHKPIVRQRGYFISGKFDQFKRNIPFSALVQAFQNLMRQLLTESASSLASWNSKILSALGENAQVIIDVIPELERIIGKQPAVPELPPTSAQNRFNILFEKFIQVFATKEHPLVIFLDDLQWADYGSLKLIKLLMTEGEIGCLLVIGAYRDNEVNSTHPLMLTLDEIRKNHAIINQINLTPLNVDDLNRLIADTLNCPPERALALTELVHQKTQGNPFFANQFLKSLHQEGIISFDFNSRYWQCDIARVKSLAASNNVVEFMAALLQKLPRKTQEVLKLAACIGNQFDLDTLAIVSEKSPAETATDLWLGLQEGLVLPQSEIYKLFQDESFSSQTQITDNREKIVVSYKFLHDRVQQAAYFLIPEDQKQSTHLKIGQLLLRNIPLQLREEKIFEIVNQLNIGQSLLNQQTERNELAQLNLIAGTKALAATAYTAATKYLNVGIELLATDSWNQQYNLTLALYEKAAEAAFLGTSFAQMEQLAEVVIQKAKSLLDKIKTYEIKIQAYTVQNQLLQAVQTALSVVQLLGIKFPEKPGNLNIILGMLGTKLTLANKKPADLINWPLMSEPLNLAAMHVLLSVQSAAYLGAPQLYPLIIFKQLKLSIKSGNTAGSVVVYATYGLILCGIVGDIETGYQFGQLALSLLERLNAKEAKTKTLFLVYNFILHWKNHAKEGVKPLLDAYSNGLETGDLEYAAYSAHQYCFRLYAIGKELAELAKEMATYNDAITKLKQETALNYNKIYHQAILNLIGTPENPCILSGEVYDEQVMLPIHLSVNDQTATFNLYFNKLILCYLFADYRQAIENAEKAQKNLGAVVGSPFVPLFYFYDSLSRLALYPDTSKPKQKQLLAQVQANQKKMQKWAELAPMNYLHKFYLVEAERDRIFGQNVKAMEYYERAIAESQKYEYINEEALAHELAAKFYLAWGFQPIAQTYLINAYYAYARWGAKAKLVDLEKRYPQLLTPIFNRETNLNTRDTLSQMTKGTLSSTSQNNSAVLDLSTVIEASQALSGEIILEQLLSTLMQVVSKNAGAQKCAFILQKAGKLVTEATGFTGDTGLEMLCLTSLLESIPVEFSSEVPVSLINYVSRTLETLVFDNVTTQTSFAADPYIIQHQPKSVLCSPIINQGKLVGILYLENNLTTGAFTPDRLEVLKVLSSQAAISIENAQLYSEVKESERRLAQFLEGVSVGVFVVDSNGKPYYSNRTAQQILGQGVVSHTSSEQIAELYQVYLGKNPREQDALIQALKGETTTVNDLEICLADKVVPIEVWGTPIFNEQGNIDYAIIAFQDITERKKAEAERERFTNELFQLNQAFSRFVPRQFLQLLEKESVVDVKLGDNVQQEMSILFSDIRDFTSLSETMTPEDNFKFINSYLSRMEPAIIENQGFIDKYIGDAIMALFNRSADDAIKAAIAMLSRVVKYNQDRQNSGYPAIQIGIGINTGSLMLGTVGGQNRMDGTVISDAVNLASRIEGLTKNYGVSLLISHHTFSRLENANQYHIRLIDRVKVKGKSKLVSVFEVFDADLPELREGKLVTRLTFEEGLLLYNKGSFSEAAERFQDCLRSNPKDKVPQLYLERCQQYNQ
ncbi:AAA family ATPase [[Phormidium ambiguum] IAM M-71]